MSQNKNRKDNPDEKKTGYDQENGNAMKSSSAPNQKEQDESSDSWKKEADTSEFLAQGSEKGIGKSEPSRPSQATKKSVYDTSETEEEEENTGKGYYDESRQSHGTSSQRSTQQSRPNDPDRNYGNQQFENYGNQPTPRGTFGQESQRYQDPQWYGSAPYDPAYGYESSRGIQSYYGRPHQMRQSGPYSSEWASGYGNQYGPGRNYGQGNYYNQGPQHGYGYGTQYRPGQYTGYGTQYGHNQGNWNEMGSNYGREWNENPGFGTQYTSYGRHDYRPDSQYDARYRSEMQNENPRFRESNFNQQQSFRFGRRNEDYMGNPSGYPRYYSGQQNFGRHEYQQGYSSGDQFNQPWEGQQWPDREREEMRYAQSKDYSDYERGTGRSRISDENDYNDSPRYRDDQSFERTREGYNLQGERRGRNEDAFTSRYRDDDDAYENDQYGNSGYGRQYAGRRTTSRRRRSERV